MIWTVEFDDRARRELRKLDQNTQNEILRYLRKRIAGGGDPTQFGKALAGNLVGLWRYRIGDYRLICRFENEVFIVMVVRVGHRRNVYDSKPLS